jgi:signal transduction histidine kinase
MFRRRLLLALSLLATAVVLQGLAATAAVGVAEHQVQRGRVASDIQRGFVELSATKQRLRTWVAQHQQGASASPALREQLQADMRQQVQRLQALSAELLRLDDSAASRQEHLQRQDALAVLADSLGDLELAVDRAAPLQPGADAGQAWQALSAVFDRAQGRDLRQLLADSSQREAAAVARERAAADRALGRMRALWLGMAAMLALAALAAAVYFTRALRRPLDQLSEGALALQRGQLQHRIPEQGADEFTPVARSMNAMAAELEQHRQSEARDRQRLEAQVEERTAELTEALQALQHAEARRRQLFADISHELRTPTTAIRGEAEVTLRGADRPAEDYRAALTRIVETSRQLGSVIDDLLAMARSDIDALSLVRRPLDLAQPYAEAVAQAQALALSRGVALQADEATHGRSLVLGDAQRLRQLLLALLDNAIRYSRPGGSVSVHLRPEGPDWCVDVQDQGIGIPPHELPQVFDRHFRGSEARRHRPDGSGLGLPIARALAQAHGGRLQLASPPGQGTLARLVLPAAPAGAALDDLATAA